MSSYEVSLWREMAQDAMVAADQARDPELRRQLHDMIARFLAMAERVDQWAEADQRGSE
jgi:spore coat protein CotF